LAPTTPVHYELWGDLASQNTFLRRLVWAEGVVILALVVVTVLSAYRPLMAVRVDQLGHAELIQQLAPTNEPGADEAQAVAKLESQYLLEVTSGSVGRDVAKAMTLMTNQFARVYRDKVKDDPSLPIYEKGNIRTVLVFDDKAAKVEAEKKGDHVVRYFVQLRARLDVHRADVLTAPIFTRNVAVNVTLLVVPRTPRTLNGLLVDFFERRVTDAGKEPAVDVAPVPPSPPNTKATP
jgi:hypothetical protein